MIQSRNGHALPFGALCYADPGAVSNAIGYAKFFSRSHDAVICVYDEAGNVIETHKHTIFPTSSQCRKTGDVLATAFSGSSSVTRS